MTDSKSKKLALTKWQKRTASQIRATAIELGYTVDGSNKSFTITSRAFHSADFYVDINRVGYYEGFIHTTIWVNATEAFMVKGETVPAREGHYVSGWSQCLWSIRTPTECNMFCDTIKTAMEVRAKRRS